MFIEKQSGIGRLLLRNGPGIGGLFLRELVIGRLFLIKDRGLVGCFSEKAVDWSAVSKKGPGIGGLFLRKLVIVRLFLGKDRVLVSCF